MGSPDGFCKRVDRRTQEAFVSYLRGDLALLCKHHCYKIRMRNNSGSGQTYWATEVVSLDLLVPRSIGLGSELAKARQIVLPFFTSTLLQEVTLVFLKAE